MFDHETEMEFFCNISYTVETVNEKAIVKLTDIIHGEIRNTSIKTLNGTRD